MNFKKKVNVALVGNPNTGKTSLFNQLTGMTQKVGNYPGITVDKKNNDDVKSLISNQTRVIKGGSWKDRSYWLDPAQRRYLPEFMAADFLGFRCAMSYLGESKQKKRPRD